MMNFKSTNKYEPTWQLTRVYLKQISSLEEKLIFLEKFLNENQTYEAWGRAINWLEGLKRGYKNSSQSNVAVCQSVIKSLESQIINHPSEELSINAGYIATKVGSWGDDELLMVWNNLYGYEKDFTSRGYRHSKLELLVDHISREIDKRKLNVKKKTYLNILQFRREASSNKKRVGKAFFF